MDGDRPDVGFCERGYLVLAAPGNEAQLKANNAMQVSCGAEVSLLDKAELRRRFPWLNVDDIELGSFGESREGWIDPYSLLQAFKRKARRARITSQTQSLALIAMVRASRPATVSVK